MVKTFLIAETLAFIATSFFLLPSSFFLLLYQIQLAERCGDAIYLDTKPQNN
jgi:hypothetical protein